MKNLNLNFAAFILIAFFTFTSCEKEGIQEMTAETTTQVSVRNLPTEGINVVFDDVQTEATAATYNESATSRNRGYKTIGCGFDYDGCTINQGNSLDIRHYPNQIDALGAQFDGQDEYFVWEVEATPGMKMFYDLDLTHMQVDLDLFVFALDSGNRLSAVKGMSINSGSANERLSLSDLRPGIYIVVVDAYHRNIAGHYNLTMECSALPNEEPGAPSLTNATNIKFEGGEIHKFSGTFSNGWTLSFDNTEDVMSFEEVSATPTELVIQNVIIEGNQRITQTITFDPTQENSVYGTVLKEWSDEAISSEWVSVITEIK